MTRNPEVAPKMGCFRTAHNPLRTEISKVQLCEMLTLKAEAPKEIAVTHGRDTDEMLKEIDRKQGASKWPETLEAGQSVDQFLWKGDPKATPVQRAGLAIYGVGFLFLFALAVVLLVVRPDGPDILGGLVIGIPSGIFAFRFLRNAVRGTTHGSRPR